MSLTLNQDVRDPLRKQSVPVRVLYVAALNFWTGTDSDCQNLVSATLKDPSKLPSDAD